MRDETELADVFALLFGLSPTESEVLAQLAGHDCVTMDRTNAARVTVCTLRKKLQAYDVEIRTLHMRGYGLPASARAALRNYLAEHDAGLIPTRPAAARAAAPAD